VQKKKQKKNISMNKFTESYKSVDIDQACVVVLASAWKRRKNARYLFRVYSGFSVLWIGSRCDGI